MRERTLAELLEGRVPAGVEALSDDERRDLALVLREARRRQGAALAKAGEDGLRFVPPLLRGVLRKVAGIR
jgi:hypothetical protein